MRRVRNPRLPGFDVVRAVALIGVVALNYYGYGQFIEGPPSRPPTFLERVFDTGQGVLSTRFAATFVTVAGVGVVLLTNRARLGDDPTLVNEFRWRLVRRGLVLLGGGYVLDWIWRGTILFYYGALFVIAAALFTLRIRWLVVIGTLAGLAAWLVQAWAVQRSFHGSYPSWVFDGGRWGSSPAAMRSVRDLVTDIWLNGTHPLLPWLAFFCCGMTIGRLIPHLDELRWPLVGIGAVMLGGGYALATVLRIVSEDSSSALGAQVALLARTDPYSRAPLYTLTTLGSSIVAVATIAWLTDRYAHSAPVEVLRRAGQLTLSLYVLHVLVFRAVVDQWHWVAPTRLGSALGLAAAYWVFAIALGSWWQRFVGDGPLERVYRRLGG